MTLVRRAYFPKATEDEYKAIRGRYAEQSGTLSETFTAEVTRAVAFIEQFPEASPVSSGRVRKKVLRKPFEYTLFMSSKRNASGSFPSHTKRDGPVIGPIDHESFAKGSSSGRSSIGRRSPQRIAVNEQGAGLIKSISAC